MIDGVPDAHCTVHVLYHISSGDLSGASPPRNGVLHRALINIHR
jgi:hypothetical protein